ncbi:MAG: UDP-N-acetylmuramate--L-alanine ligase [Oscillospiraceae bacterium]|nr:UDP-N-acetylmuramate--L-alanine ligase [Oscillospiraceae bacterium]
MMDLINLSDILKYLENKKLKIFFSGIGGISMSAIAAALKQRGYEVGGSDITEKSETAQLRNMGIDVKISHRSENVAGYDLFVYNARIKEDNPEMVEARRQNMPIVRRLQMLGALMQGYKTAVGISGTHGKSSVTSMTSEIFMQAKTDPTFFIGAVYPPVNSAYKIGKNDYCIVEADEYADSFLDFYPNISVILNIEMDHPDFFSDLDSMICSYEKFLNNTSGAAVINADDENAVKSATNFKGEILSYSLKDPMADIFIKNISHPDPDGFPEFDIYAKDRFYAHIKLQIPGEYNIYNAAAAASVAYRCGLEGRFAERGLGAYKGAGRRFEYKGLLNGAKVYDDYAHHPTEVKKAIVEMQKIAKRKGGVLWYVFQPHTYSRTAELFGELCGALEHADRVIITEIFSATEKNKYGISSADVAAKLQNCVFIESFEEIADHMAKSVQKNDLVVITGAGDINNLTKLLV